MSVIYKALKERFCAPEYAIFFEVANGTGSNIRRYADALAMGLFPSRGNVMHGIEVKSSRGDWLRELKQPNKAEEGVFKYCDHWWIATMPGVIKSRDELPPTWGWLEYKVALKEGEQSSLRQMVAAPKLEPVPMTRAFIAALLRRANEADTAMIDRLVREKTARLDAERENRIKNAVDQRMRSVEERMEKIDAIEKHLGISLTDWSARPGYGRIIKALSDAGFASDYGGLAELANTLESAAKKARDALVAFDEAAPPDPEDKLV